MRYIGSVYRPPSEAYSLIVQLTVGCSHNRCAFCSMYREKQFFVRAVEEVLADLAWCRRQYASIGRIFLADGDALIAPAEDLLRILEYIRTEIPECERVSCYASPKSVRRKTDAELRALRAANLQMVYMGLESGSDDILRRMRKGGSAAQIVEAAQRGARGGNGVVCYSDFRPGRPAQWQEHAEATGAALSQIKAEYIGLLTLMVEPGTPAFQWVREGTLQLLSPQEVLAETYTLLAHTDSEGSVLRMNHASNYLSLRGTLNRDRKALLDQLQSGMDGSVPLKREDYRAL